MKHYRDVKTSLFLYNFYMEYILIGKIINTHGIKGELKVELLTDFFAERFKKDSTIYIGENYMPFIVHNCRMHKGFLLLQLKDNEDINLVEKYKNMYIYKNKEDVAPLKDGEYYYRDLKGLDVYQDNILKGKVISVEEGNKYNFLRIKMADEEKLIPYLKQFILNVDLDNHRIDVVLLEGLL